jgi:hypothetical protein
MTLRIFITPRANTDIDEEFNYIAQSNYIQSFAQLAPTLLLINTVQISLINENIFNNLM